MYVLIASFDINLAIRDLLTDRNTAAMITWTEIVFYSMWNFLKVSYNFYIISVFFTAEFLSAQGNINVHVISKTSEP